MIQSTTQMKSYYTALYAFLQVVRSNLVLCFPNAADSSLSYVRLSINEVWEITEMFTDNLGLMPGFGEKGIPQGICLPLVLPPHTGEEFLHERPLGCQQKPSNQIGIREGESALKKLK